MLINMILMRKSWIFEIIFGTMWYDRTSSYHSSVAESPYICPPEFRADMVWVSGAFVYRHINRCGSAQLFKKEFIR